MPGTLSRFRIEGLHNKFTVDIPISDNKLVLIGENGTGKSTVANFIYFFLTAQWKRMRAYNFKKVIATIDSREIGFTKAELLKNESPYSDRETSYANKLSLARRQHILDIIATRPVEELLSNPREIVRYAEQVGISPGMLHTILEHWSDEPQLFSGKLQESMKMLRTSPLGRVLYLPTYRRVEQDMASIFPELTRSLEFKNLMDHWRHRAQGSSYIELVQFGMQDVEETITRKMSELDRSWREDLGKLTGRYLRDVIQGAYQSAEPAEIGELDEDTINAIFNRIDQSVLPQPEQRRLRDMVAKIRSEHHVQENDKVVVHFLTRLIELHKNQQKKERDVREFVAVCNEYLSGKEFIYDDMNFKILIRQLDDLHVVGKEAGSGNLKMSMLSSGEKQIVSLFSQIYLSGSSSYFVIIDEPELSLSVPWQKRFLPDILHSGRCNGLIAVTHSPFICDNELDTYMYSLEQFMEPFNAVR